MIPLTGKLLSLSGRSIRQIAARQAHHKTGPDFHDKYGNVILAGGLVFCVSVWSYVCTQTGITWNLSPVGKITPQEWRTD
ncbi:cytochrome c oxidase subunit 7B, mitochondrial [Pristis pectinata]|uniref:cytochrome c oxidase subunit 7B, mitochondrial n=1 Tax=Pristis pectinata TaxID=685728 RepID=UPI00223CAC4E|nr:cytochrome c oxidase subunit 7B, mitochondrial [Pristis pectinata]